MKLVTFEADGQEKLGVVRGQEVVDLDAASGGESCFADMLALLEGGRGALDRADRLAESAPADARVAMADVVLCAPVPRPRKILCLAGNYQAHLKESGSSEIAKQRSTPRVFMKPHTVVNRPGGTIVLPRISTQVDWELELAVVIGRTAKDVPAERGLDHVAGYTIFNDVSARSLVIAEGRDPREGDRWFDWLNGKWPDTFGPMGPWLVTRDDVPDPQDLDLKLWVNDHLHQDGNTSQMIFSVAELVAFCSRLMTLVPGDIVSTGTPAGVGSGKGVFLRPGDVVRCQIEAIGTLSNPVGEGHTEKPDT